MFVRLLLLGRGSVRLCDDSGTERSRDRTARTGQLKLSLSRPTLTLWIKISKAVQ
jgi:hypothetical protein